MGYGSARKLGHELHSFNNEYKIVTGGKIWYVTCILHFIWILLRNLTFTLPTFKKIAVIPPYVSVCLLTVNSEISQWVILMPYPKMPIREHQEV